MKTLAEILADADPVNYEPRRSARDRLVNRQRILDAPRSAEKFPRRRIVIITVVALTLVSIAAGSRIWSRVAADVVAAVRFEVRLAEENPASGLRETAIPGASRTIYLHPETVVANGDISEAHVIQGAAPSAFNIVVTFSADGAAKMRRATERHIGRPMAILLDGEVVAAPVVRARITTSAIMSGNFTRVEAERIVGGIVGR